MRELHRPVARSGWPGRLRGWSGGAGATSEREGGGIVHLVLRGARGGGEEGRRIEGAAGGWAGAARG